MFKFSFLALLLMSTLGIHSCDRSTDPPMTNPSLGPVAYNPDVSTIIFNNCLTCHGGPAPSYGLRLETYDQVRSAVETQNLIARINDAANPMPPAGRLIQENRDRIVKWAEDGFPLD